MQGVGWLERKLQDSHRCPVCSALHEEGNPHLIELQSLAKQLRTLTFSVQQAPAKLDQELAGLRQELRDREVQISKVSQKRKYLEGESAALSAQRQKVRQIYLFVGRVEQALENLRVSRNVEELRSKVELLSQRLEDLKRALDPRLQRDRLDAALNTVAMKIAAYANLLRLEHAGENVRINLRELTLQFSPLSGKTTISSGRLEAVKTGLGTTLLVC